MFTGDRGDLLGGHEMWEKNLLWEEAEHVPLIIRGPGIARGKVSKKMVEMIDLYPTLTEMAGLPHYARNEGFSFASLLRNPNDPAWDRPAFSQIVGGRSVRYGPWRYTEWVNGKLGRELYNLEEDPLSHRNLANEADQAATVARLAAMLPQGEVEDRPGYTATDPRNPHPGRGNPPFPMVPNTGNCAHWGVG